MGYRKNHQFKFKQTNIEIKRFYSAASTKSTVVLRTDREVCKLDPLWVTGFVDGEGSFQIRFVKDQTRNIGWRVQLCFSIEVHLNDRALLVEIKNYLGVGRIYKGKAESVRLLVISKEDLAKIIYHFNKFPLLTKKQSDFKLFKMVFDLMEKKSIWLKKV